MSEPQYQAVHLTRIDAEIFATRVGREVGPMYLQQDSTDFYEMRMLEWARVESLLNGIVDF